MKPAPFLYYAPFSLEEVLALLSEHGDEAKVLAGGQSLVPLMSMRLASPARIVDINRLPGLADITTDDSGMRVGALARHRDLERYDDSARYANVLPRQATEHVAHATIRNRGTTVGSLVHADPAAEMPAVLRLLGGSVEAVSSARGSRTITADQLFVGPLESALEPDEIAVAATFPHPPEGSGSGWVELSRRHGDYALVGVGAVGVVTEVTLQAAEAFVLHAEERPTPLPDVLACLPELIETNDHFEFYWVPYTERTLTKANNRVAVDDRPRGRLSAWLTDDLFENAALGAVARVCRAVPPLTPTLLRGMAWVAREPVDRFASLALPGARVSDSAAVFSSPGPASPGPASPAVPGGPSSSP